MKRVWLVLCLAPWLCGAGAKIDPNLYLNDVKYLASPELKGRATGSPELEKAARFIAARFREFGLKPVPGNSYLQAFSVTTDARLGKQNHFAFTENGHATSLRCTDDFVPFNFSASGKASGAVVFAGYGITAPELHYDDYAGIDVKGKFVLVLRHQPQENDDHSVFAGTAGARFVNKAANAKMHGAAGLILIDDPVHHPNQPWELQKFGSVQGPLDAGIAILQVKEERVDVWFHDAGKSLSTIEADIDKDLKPESFAFPDAIRVDANVDVERLVKTVHNVVAYQPGETDEYVILGAHYDHLGMGGQYSLAPNVTAIHPGADDNASGTAGLLELARWYSKQPKQKRGILFLSFAGEELGLLGSAWYVAHPDLPLAKAVAMINMDMIGRIRDGKIYIGGAATGSGLRPLLERVTPKYHLNADYSEGPMTSGSDHTSFVTGQVPVLFFFSGLHGDYHKPSDTWDKIDSADAATLLDMVAEVADDLREAPDRPQFVRVAPAPQPAGAPSGGGYGPWFGSVPDFGEGVKGVKFAGITAGSPAAKAGLKAGDVMVEFDGKKIDNLYDFTYALQSKKPGDQVLVKVLRDGQTIEATVLLARRP
ncbi:MAG TPA: M28 family peptidase [Bryobacteraceae bacterium]|nr:M28 family peptidase [Bryobacteraceae bacterium]